MIYSDPDQIQLVEKQTERIAKKIGFSVDEIENIAIAVTEAIGNAINHGNKADRSKKVFIQFRPLEDGLEIRVKDEGLGFDLSEIANPLAPENLYKESGRGIFIVRSLMDSVDFAFYGDGTEVILTKKLRVY